MIISLRTTLLVLLFGLGALRMEAQIDTLRTSGTVTFLSGDNAYIRFESTTHITIGDTLFSDGKPCLQVIQKSSFSTVCKALLGADCTPKIDDRYTHQKLKPRVKEAPDRKPDTGKNTDRKAVPTGVDSSSITPIDSNALPPKNRFKLPVLAAGERRYARISAAYNGVVSPDTSRGGYLRSVYRAQVDWERIQGTPFSVEGYVQYQEYGSLLGRDAEVSSRPARWNVFNAALLYDNQKSFSASVGRRVNRKISSIGAIDGVQMEARHKGLFLGAIAGYRPNYNTFGIDLDRFQYGAFTGWEGSGESSHTSLTTGFIEQTLNGQIDRRYMYFQGSHRVGSLYLFSSAQADLYANFDTASAQQLFDVKQFYISARYRWSSQFNIFASYDSRERIIFYETFDTEVEQLLADANARNGWRVRLQWMPWSFLRLNGSYNYRIEKSTSNYSDNIQLSASFYDLPWTGGTLILLGQRNTSRYLNSDIATVRYARNLGRGGPQLMAYSRYLNYSRPQNDIMEFTEQWYHGMQVNWSLPMDFQLGLMGEYSLNGDRENIRFQAQIIKRFKS